jgi:predicted DNA-binding transcriptional regulator AlpA
MAMKPKRIVRQKEVYGRLGCGHTKFEHDYKYHEGGEENVPGTNVPRLKPIPLGPRNIGFLDNEIDNLIDALAALRDAPAVERAS